ncbi:MAG: DUF5916 domain-containing protein [Saprospiraceae bacterium]
MKSLLFTLVTLVSLANLNPSFGNNGIDPKKKVVEAALVDIPPVIDGVMDEPAWMKAVPAVDFVQFSPAPGTTPSQRSAVHVLYNNNGIYIGAKLMDARPDSIQKELSERDNIANADFFGVVFDAYRDGINGFEFITTAANVQFDAKISNMGEDESWDAVWDSAVSIDDNGWVVEMFIPYSAIRFPEQEEHLWHFNIIRRITRVQEKSFWNEVDPEQNGFVNQSGYLKGLANIKSPLRLQATPFIALYGQQHHDVSTNPVNSYGHIISGGMDVKWGLSDAFTLDMTLIPDFGEAQSDNQVLNLTPFEVQFNENRAFFTEGTELFSKGGLFYSRRVGGQPIHYYDIYDQYDEEDIVNNPQQSQLYNATKISGRTSKGLGIGFFNATSGRTYATVRDAELGEQRILTDPLTNYNVLVLDQNLPNNSYAALINTTVMREGDAYDANVTGVDFTLRNKANSYALSGKSALSQLYHPGQTDLGHTISLRAQKTSGNLVAGINYLEESDTYDINDLGFLYNNNERSFSGYVEYNQYEPTKKFNSAGLGLYSEYNMLYAPNEFTDWGLNLWAWVQGKQFWNYNVWTYIAPGTNYDFFEPREDGRVWVKPGGGNAGFWVGTDSRKKLRLELNGNYWTSWEKGWNNGWLSIGTRYRFNDKLNMYLNIEKSIGNNGYGWVNTLDETAIDPVTGEPVTAHNIYFGKRDRNTVETFFRTNYTFNANMTVSFRLRHYWSTVTYESFQLLNSEGALVSSNYSDNHDFDFDAFNIDLIYRWRFAPGSDLFLIWKNSLFSDASVVAPNYFRNLDGLFQSPQDNSLSLKVIYFLDYARLVTQKS